MQRASAQHRVAGGVAEVSLMRLKWSRSTVESATSGRMCLTMARETTATSTSSANSAPATRLARDICARMRRSWLARARSSALRKVPCAAR